MATEVGKLYYDLSIDDKNLKSGLNSADKDVSSFGTKLAGIGKVMAAGMAVAGAAAVAFGVKAVQAYSEAQVAQAALEHAVISVSHATREQLKQTEDLADALQRKGVLDGDNIKLGLAQLSTFGLSNKAVQALGGSLADLAVNQFGVNASGEQLSDTANMIAKALNGQFGVLEKSGIRFTKAQKHAIEFGTEMQKVDAINQGFAQNLKFTNETALKTFSGGMAKTKVILGDLQEAIGKIIVERLTPMLAKFNELITSAGGVEGVMNKLRAGVDSLGLALQKVRPYTDAIAATWSTVLFPALSMVANILIDRVIPSIKRMLDALSPLQPLLVVLAGLIGMMVLGPLVVLSATLTYLSFVISTLVGWVSNLINWWISLGGVILSVTRGIREAIGSAFLSAWNYVTGIWSKATSFFSNIGNSIAGAIGGAIEGVKNTVKSAVNWIIDKANTAIRGVNKVSPPGVPEIGEIPKLSKGIENFGGGLAYVHRGEVLTGLAPGSSVIKKSDVQGMMNAAGGGGGGSNVTINLSGIMTESREGTRQVARTLIQALNEGLKAKGMEEIQL